MEDSKYQIDDDVIKLEGIVTHIGAMMMKMMQVIGGNAIEVQIA